MVRNPPNAAAAVNSALTVPFGVVVAVGVRLARRPSLWRTAWRQCRGLAAPRWWQGPPYLPLPPATYLRFRLQTMYGGAGVLPTGNVTESAADVLRWLEWSRVERDALVSR